MTPIPFVELLPFIVINLTLLLGWLSPMLIALYDLRHHQASTIVRVVWVLVIVLIPLIGPIAFMLVEGWAITRT